MNASEENAIAWKVVVVQTVAGHRFVMLPGDSRWLNRSDLERLANTLATVARLTGEPEEDS